MPKGDQVCDTAESANRHKSDCPTLVVASDCPHQSRNCVFRIAAGHALSSVVLAKKQAAMRLLLSFALLLACLDLAVAQRVLGMTHARPWPADRYADTDGSPWLFDQWLPAIIYDGVGAAYLVDSLNLNGLTPAVEVRKDGRYIELDERAYPRIRVVRAPADTVELRALALPSRQWRYLVLRYAGLRLQLFEEFLVSRDERRIETPGKTEYIRKFVQRRRFWLVRQGEKPVLLKSKKKELLRQLGPYDALSAFAKKEKLNLKKPDDLVRLVAFAERLATDERAK